MSDDLRIDAERRGNPVAKYIEAYKKVIEERQNGQGNTAAFVAQAQHPSIFGNGFASNNTQNA